MSAFNLNLNITFVLMPIFFNAIFNLHDIEIQHSET